MFFIILVLEYQILSEAGKAIKVDGDTKWLMS